MSSVKPFSRDGDVLAARVHLNQFHVEAIDSWDVVWRCSKFELTLCELSRNFCALIRPCTAVNSYAALEAQVVIRNIKGNHF